MNELQADTVMVIAVDNIVNSIGNKIEDLRQKNDFSQTELSQKADYHETFVGKLERGESMPSLKSLVKIAEALEVPLLKLFEGIPSSFPIND